MGENGFKRDKTPYYVFACSKCKQYSYVKTTQKSKKCLRCGRMHQVKNLEPISEIIEGITAAKDRVIFLQDELAQKELGFKPVLRAENDFSLIASTSKKLVKKESNPQNNDNNASKFESILKLLHHQYQKYPYYLIELAMQDDGISKKKTKCLISEFLNKGILKKTNEQLYFLA